MKSRSGWLITTVLLISFTLGMVGSAGPAGAESRPVGGDKPRGQAPVLPVEVVADRDGNRIFDNLEARLAAAGAGEALPVIILFDRPLAQVDLPAMQRQLGGFAVRHRFETVAGIATSLTGGQVVAASRLPFVKQVEYDMPVQATLDTSSYWFGVQAARATWGITGNTDGLTSYSKNDVVVAVVDTGIDAGHVDLDGGKVIGWHDVINGRSTPYDDQGHGTHVAGIVAGEGQGSSAYTGVAPGAALVGVKVLNSSGSGSLSGVIAGVEWVIANKATYGIRVMNLSLGAAGSSDGKDSLSTAVNKAADNGIVPVVAAGNSGPWRYTVGTPGAAAKAITVGAMADVGEKGFNLASFSSRGPTADNRNKPDIASPGVAITAAQAGTASGYVSYSGTSMATPFTAGVAALMLARNSSLTPADVKTRLQQTAVDWGPAGLENEHGAGRLDALAAIRAADPDTPAAAGPTPPPHVFLSGHLNQDGDAAWHDLVVADTTKPLALTLIVPTARCTFSYFGWCLSADKDFDLELYNPSGQLIAYSNLPDRQDTINVMPATTGAYRARVYVCAGCGGNDDYWLDVSGAAVEAVNDPPLASGASATTAQDTPVVITLSGTDVETCELSFTISSGPASGALGAIGNSACTAGSPHADSATVTYTPGAGFTGSDSFTYTVSDGTQSSSPATVAITVASSPGSVHVGDLDGDRDVFRSGNWQARVTVLVHDVSHNPVGDATVTLGWSAGDRPSSSCTTDSAGTCTAQSGTISKKLASVVATVSGVTPSALGYDPSDNHDPDGDSDGTALTIRVNGANNAPAAYDDSYGTTQNTALGVAAPGVLGNDVDGDGDALTAVLDSGPTNGSLTLNADGSFVYTPAPGYTGTDSFTYRASDGTLQSSPATVTISVVDSASSAHIADLDGASQVLGNGRWRAKVTVLVHDAIENLVSSATVAVNWGDGSASSCTTDGSGACTVQSGWLPSGTSSVTATVQSVSHAALSYDAASNHDLDGDGVPDTSITVAKVP